MRLVLHLLGLVLLISVVQSKAPIHETKNIGLNLPKSTVAKDLSDYLLPTSTFPIFYDVSLTPFMRNPAAKNFTFDGRITIRITALEVTSEIVMHAWDLNILSISIIRVRDSTLVPVKSPTFSPDDRQFFIIPLNADLEVNELYDIFISYTGVLNDEIAGFSRSEYRDENGNIEYLAITHLEPTSARRMMPCYDQPDFKARVYLHVAREPGYYVLANTRIASEGDPVPGLDGWEWVHFDETPVMSTYLICIAVHKFSQFTSISDPNFKVWSRPEVVSSGAYASEITPAVMQYMTGFTNITYDLPKYDQIGMVQFTAGAMENWGLITFTEPLLLYNPSVDTIWDKNLVSKVTTHEAAHQWFGNLVSPKWWSSIWLNEGFARYFEYFAFHAVVTDWQMDHIFVIEQIYTSFRADVLATTHPVYADYLDTPESIHAMFDTITYNKGACLVRLMINLLGEDNFKSGINNYLTALSYRNAHQDDLFLHLSPFAPTMPVTFKELMESWTLKSGFPLVTVTRDYDFNTAFITQTKFSDSGNDTWILPLSFTSENDPQFSQFEVREWLLPSDSQLIVNNGIPNADQWVLFNTQQIGFYRVNYDATNWALLSSYMSTPGFAEIIDPINRAQLMDDAFTLADAGILDYVTALYTTTYLQHEPLWLPWAAVTDHLQFIRDRMYGSTEGIQLFQTYMQTKLELVYNTVNGFSLNEGEPHSTLITRWLATRWTCDMQHETCNLEGSDLFQQWLTSADPSINNPVSVDLRAPAYCAGQRLGGEKEQDFLMQQYLTYSKNGVTKDKDYVISALGCSLDTAILQRYLNETFQSVAVSDSLTVLKAVYSQPLGIDIALNFLITYWRQLDLIYDNVGVGFNNIAPKLNTIEHYNAVQKFLSDNTDELGTTNENLINEALAKLQENIAWNDLHLSAVMDFFLNN